MTKWARLFILCLLAAPAFLGKLPFPVGEDLRFGLPGLSDQAIYYALFFNFMLFVIIGRRHYFNILTLSILFSLTILVLGPVVRFFFESPETYSAYYIGKFINMLTVVPAALAIILSIPVAHLERKLLTPGTSKRTWRKAVIIAIRVVRYVIFQVIPSMKERILEEAIPHHCISQIWKRDRRAGRPGNAVLNIFLFVTQFGVEVFIYALGASMKNVDLWASWITQVAAHVDETPLKRGKA
jgi:hypothetical protein